MSKKEGLYSTKVHGHVTYFKVIDGDPNILSKEKGKLCWCPTLMEDKRYRRLRPTSVEEIIEVISDMSRSALLK